MAEPADDHQRFAEKLDGLDETVQCIDDRLVDLKGVVSDHVRQEAQVVRDAVAEVVIRHEEGRHHPSLQSMVGKTPSEVVTEFFETRPIVLANEKGIERLVNLMEGDPVEHLDGTVGPDRGEGMITKIEQVLDATNGKLRLDWKDRTAIIAAVAITVAKAFGLF